MKPPRSPASHGALPPEGALAALGRPGGGSVTLDGGAQPITPDDIRAMPAVTVALLIAEVLEINADFFLRNLPPLAASLERIGSIGSASPSSSSAPGTGPTPSGATAWPSSGAT